MSHAWLIALTLLAGALMPLQAGINGQLARHTGNVMLASLISFMVGTLALLLIVLYQRATPAAGALRELSWWHWTGGLLGAYFIATAAFAGPKVGALLFMALVLAGQLGMALLLDHQGWVGFREAPVSLGKVAGLAMVLLGVWMIRRG